ncbi:MAG: hypothetical protein IPH04_09040 [Saprospirales bacterium]|nr:hypothetical protein [Saprospirales bacterium]
MPNKHLYFPECLWGSLLLIAFFVLMPFLVFSQDELSTGTDFQQYRYSKDFRFRRLGTEEGLSNPYVTDLLQDRLGFIWVATSDGLNRYDGYGFKTYKNDPDDPLSLSNNQVTALLEDEQGFLWVGTAKGLNRFDPRTGQLLHFFSDTLHPEKLNDDHIRSLHSDRLGKMWIGTNKGGLNLLDPQKQSFSHFIHIPGDSTSLGDNCVQTICEDRQGNLWLGTMGGLCFFDRNTGKFKTWTEDLDNPNALSQNWVNAVIEDPEGYVWAGATHGLNRLDPAIGLFERFWPGKPRPFWLGPNGHRIISFYLDRSENLWIGTQSGGLYRYDSCLNQFYGAFLTCPIRIA